jgi:hypothetical protein
MSWDSTWIDYMMVVIGLGGVCFLVRGIAAMFGMDNLLATLAAWLSLK